MYIFIKTNLESILKNKSGVITIEYGLGLALFGIMMAVALSDLGSTIRNYMCNMSTGNGCGG